MGGIKGPKKTVSVSVYSITDGPNDTCVNNLVKRIDVSFDTQGMANYEKEVKYYKGEPERTVIIKSERGSYEMIHFDKDSAYFKWERWERKNKRYAYRHITHSPLDTGDSEDEVTITRRNGRLVIVKGMESWNGIKEETRTRYSKRHKPLQQDSYSDGRQWLKKSWEYDAKHRLVEDITTHIQNGKTTMEQTCRYDTNGNLTERISNVVDYPSSATQQIYRYDSANHEIEWLQYTADGSLPMRGCSFYDARGCMLRKTYEDTLGKVNFEHTYSYDIDGRKIDEAGKSTKSSYSYRRTNVWGKIDTYGNWRTVTEYRNGSPKLITIRKIDYY